MRLAQVESARTAYEGSRAVQDPAARRSALLTLYLHHGCPFGGRLRGLQVWEAYDTGTTVN